MFEMFHHKKGWKIFVLKYFIGGIGPINFIIDISNLPYNIGLLYVEYIFWPFHNAEMENIGVLIKDRLDLTII